MWLTKTLVAETFCAIDCSLLRYRLKVSAKSIAGGNELLGQYIHW